jgi:hypothetical protein
VTSTAVELPLSREPMTRMTILSMDQPTRAATVPDDVLRRIELRIPDSKELPADGLFQLLRRSGHSVSGC